MKLSSMHKFAKLVTQTHRSKSLSSAIKTMEPIVTIKNGRIKGAVAQLPDDRTSYFSFKGIRYANVTKRFSAPEPVGWDYNGIHILINCRRGSVLQHTHWNNIYDATKHGPVCPQYDMMTFDIVNGDENCLFLNVYTPTIKSTAELPVMVFIHGGAFMSGSGDANMYGPEFLIQHNVVLVTINYRLEILGFLCLDTPEVPGNAGMKDQVAALRWVQENIREFGGDPNNVTLFGESAGGASVTLHMQSQMSKGLFHRAIAQSGVGIADWAKSTKCRERAFTIGKILGHNASSMDDISTDALLKFLRSVPAISLAKLTFKSMDKEEKKRGLPIHFAPVTEVVGDNPFLTSDPLNSLSLGKMNSMPLMIGYNSAEAVLMLVNVLKKLKGMNKEPEYLVPKELVGVSSPEKAKELGKEIKKFYVNGRDFTEEEAEAISNILSDTYFVYNAHRYAYYHSTSGPTYFYVFSSTTDLNIIKNAFDFAHIKGAAHADDLFYLFCNDVNKDFCKDNANLRSLVYNMTKLWADFAKTGNPTPEGSAVKWEPYTPAQRNYLDIGETFVPGKDAHHDRVIFWNQLYRAAGARSMDIKSNL